MPSLLNRFLPRDRFAVPAAVAFVVIGLVLAATSAVLPHIPALHASSGKHSMDFFRGFLIGIAIVAEIIGVGGIVPALRGARQKRPDGSS